MTAVRIYTYDKCSTCRKAIQWLKQQGIEFDSVPIVDSPPSAKELSLIRDLARLEVRKLFNTSGQSYRQGGWKDKLAGLSDEEAFSALTNDGKLIKRPIVIGKDFALVGFKEDAYTQAFSDKI